MFMSKAEWMRNPKARNLMQSLPGAKPKGALQQEPPPPEAYGTFNGVPMSQMPGYRGLYAPPGPTRLDPRQIGGQSSGGRTYSPNPFQGAPRQQVQPQPQPQPQQPPPVTQPQPQPQQPPQWGPSNNSQMMQAHMLRGWGR